MSDDEPLIDVQLVGDSSGDALLGVFASFAQEGLMRTGITLNVAGQVISGELIGRDAWFDLLAHEAHEVGEEAGTAVSSIRDGVRDAAASRGLPEDDVSRYGYLHLRDAVLVQNGEPVGTPLMWRIRISEVAGWSLQSVAGLD